MSRRNRPEVPSPLAAVRRTGSAAGGERRKIVKFVVVNGVKTVFGYGLYLLALALGVHYDLALLADYLFALTAGYVMNRSWTFAGQGQPSAPLLKYLAAYVLVFAANWAALELVVRIGVGPALGQLPCLVLATIASYLLQRYWVFNGRPPV